ncbi:MAG: hypothetical protein ACFE0I_24120 [Elainellaceae cyanobacterium]
MKQSLPPVDMLSERSPAGRAAISEGDRIRVYVRRAEIPQLHDIQQVLAELGMVVSVTRCSVAA